MENPVPVIDGLRLSVHPPWFTIVTGQVVVAPTVRVGVRVVPAVTLPSANATEPVRLMVAVG